MEVDAGRCREVQGGGWRWMAEVRAARELTDELVDGVGRRERLAKRDAVGQLPAARVHRDIEARERVAAPADRRSDGPPAVGTQAHLGQVERPEARHLALPATLSMLTTRRKTTAGPQRSRR